MPGAPVRADGFSDALIGYRYGTAYREPANPQTISKNIIQFTYANGGSFGNNFLNLDVLLSDNKDPAAVGGGGAQELYLVFRHEFSLSGLTHRSWAFGPVRDVGITAGFDFNSKDDTFGSRVRKLIAGPTFEFKVPGYAHLMLGVAAEHNHNGIVNNLNIANPPIPGNNDVAFTTAYRIESAWGYFFKMGLPAKFQGFANYTGPKGNDGFGTPTAPELLAEAALLFDIGSTFGKGGKVYAGIGYQYWHNKFGNQPGVGTQASPLQFETEIHL